MKKLPVSISTLEAIIEEVLVGIEFDTD